MRYQTALRPAAGPDFCRESNLPTQPRRTSSLQIARRRCSLATMIESPSVLYAREPNLEVAEFRRVLVESGLGRIRPIDDEPRLKLMLQA